MFLKKLLVTNMCTLLLAGVTFAGQRTAPPARGGKKNVANAANAEKSAPPVKKTPPAGGSGNCQSIRSQLNELTAQEKQLHEQARADEAQRVSYLEQAKAVEAQRVALERTEVRGQINKGIEAQVREKEQQRVGLEHQAEAIERQRAELEKQADGIGRQRLSLEEEHRAECHLRHTNAVK